MDNFEPCLACQTQFSAIDCGLAENSRVDGGACGPRPVVADEVVWDFARGRVQAPGTVAWAGVTGGYAQINNSGADFAQHQVVFFIPTSDFRLPTTDDTRLVVLGQPRSRLLRCSLSPDSHPPLGSPPALRQINPSGWTDPDLLARPSMSLL